MKHILSIVILLAFSASLSAQSLLDRVLEIQRAYANAQKMMEMAQEEPNLDNSMHVTMRRMFGGSGMQTFTVDYFCGDFSDVEPEYGVSIWSPYFIRVKFNWAARITVKEYLIEPKTSALMFVYTISDDNPLNVDELGEGKYEVRKYYNPDGSYCAGTAKLILPDGTVRSLDTELANQYTVFGSDLEEIKFVNHLITVHNQMMNYEE